MAHIIPISSPPDVLRYLFIFSLEQVSVQFRAVCKCQPHHISQMIAGGKMQVMPDIRGRQTDA